MSARPTRSTSSTATKTKKLFRDVLRARQWRQEVELHHSGLFLDFLAGNQTYECTPWGMPRATSFRLAEALLPARRRLYQDLQGADGDTDWETYGTGKYEKCADCMVHCGFEATAFRLR
jgi:hypothetical protein